MAWWIIEHREIQHSAMKRNVDHVSFNSRHSQNERTADYSVSLASVILGMAGKQEMKCCYSCSRAVAFDVALVSASSIHISGWTPAPSSSTILLETAMNRSITLVLFLLTVAPSFSQELIWQKTYGGMDKDYGQALVPLDDGGFMIAGWTASYRANPKARSSLYVVRTNRDGDTLWQRDLSTFHHAEARAIFDIGGNQFRIIGMAVETDAGPGHLQRIYVATIDADGNMLSEKVLGDTVDNANVWCVRRTSDGGYVLCGNLYQHVMIAKLDSGGALSWQRAFGVTRGNYDHAQGVRETSDGGFVLAGHSAGAPAIRQDAILMKVDSQGDSLWARLIRGDSSEIGYDVIERPGGGLLLAGFSDSQGYPGENSKLYIVRTSRDGVVESIATPGSLANSQIYLVERTNDGGLIMVGAGGGDGSQRDMLLVKTDAEGRLQWEKTFEVAPDWMSVGLSIQQLADNTYVIVGYGGPGRAGVEAIEMLLMRISDRPSVVRVQGERPSIMELW